MKSLASGRVWRASLLAAFIGIGLAAGATRAEAQSADGVFTPSELSSLPKVSSPSKVQSLIQRSYPSDLRSRGVGGKVQVQFIVGADGKVEQGSVKVVSATTPALAEAASEVAALLEFTPGTKDGRPVRTQVLLPIVYSPS